MVSTKDGLALALSRLGPGELPFVITADLAGPLGLEPYAAEHPDLFFDVGVAEQAMVGIAAGLASGTRRCLAATFAVFLLRATEQIRNGLLVDGRDVVLVGSHGGIATGPNGVTHQAIEDLGVMCALHGLDVWSPASPMEAADLICRALRAGGTHYVRLARSGWPLAASLAGALPTVVVDWPAPVGCIISHGIATALAVQVAGLQAAQQKHWRVIHVPHIKPLVISELAPLLVGRLVSYEDHLPDSGLGAQLQLALADAGIPVVVHRLGVRSYMGSDDAEVLFRAAGLDPQSVSDTVGRLL